MAHGAADIEDRSAPGEREKLVARVNGLYGGIFDPGELRAVAELTITAASTTIRRSRAVVTEGDCIDLR